MTLPEATKICEEHIKNNISFNLNAPILKEALDEGNGWENK